MNIKQKINRIERRLKQSERGGCLCIEITRGQVVGGQIVCAVCGKVPAVVVAVFDENGFEIKGNLKLYAGFDAELV